MSDSASLKDRIPELIPVSNRSYGKSLRKKTPRLLHAKWNPPSERPDPIEILINSNFDRLEDLIPVRFGRMMKSPFAFLRGAASIMASDFSYTASSGIYTQCCGDCHLMNFGAYATPERNMVFDINDFDESHPAPWEWDLKRLAVSFVVAGDYRKFTDKTIRKALLSLVKSYRENMEKYSRMKILDVWYSKIDEKNILKSFSGDKNYIKMFKKYKVKARQAAKDHELPKMVEIKKGKAEIIDEKPFLYHSDDIPATAKKTVKFFKEYGKSLPKDKKILFKRFNFADVAYKVAGVGSVGTRCYVALFMGEKKETLLLQVKEARQSVLEPFTQKSEYKNNGERIVFGQKLMQASSDIFLGWTNSDDGKNFYVRQLRDMKIETDLDSLSREVFINYGALCGSALARSHAKAGDASSISGYIGNSNVMDEAISEFAFKYAEQNEMDFEKFLKAVKSGKIEVR